MLKILDEIRQQPLHIRKLFMWTMVVISFSLVGTFWFNKTRGDVVAMIHGETEKKTTDEQASPFATIKDSLSDLRANISELFDTKSKHSNQAPATSPVPPQRLP